MNTKRLWIWIVLFIGIIVCVIGATYITQRTQWNIEQYSNDFWYHSYLYWIRWHTGNLRFMAYVMIGFLIGISIITIWVSDEPRERSIGEYIFYGIGGVVILCCVGVAVHLVFSIDWYPVLDTYTHITVPPVLSYKGVMTQTTDKLQWCMIVVDFIVMLMFFINIIDFEYYEEITLERIAAERRLLTVKFCAICGSELHSGEKIYHYCEWCGNKVEPPIGV